MANVMEQAFARARMRGPDGRLRDYAMSALDRAEAGERVDERAIDIEALNRCRKHAREAMKQANDNLGRARGLFLEYLMDDAPALNALMGAAVVKRADEYLNRIWREHHPAETRSGGQVVRDARHGYAPRNGGGATGTTLMPTDRVSPAAPSPERQEAAREVARMRANSLLSLTFINGRRMRDAPAGEARAWAAKRGREARWVEVVCAGLMDHMVIGEYVDDEKAEQLWKDTENA